MAHRTVKACIQRVEDVERQALQFSTLLAETREDLNNALQEIMDGVAATPSQIQVQVLDSPADPENEVAKQDVGLPQRQTTAEACTAMSTSMTSSNSVAEIALAQGRQFDMVDVGQIRASQIPPGMGDQLGELQEIAASTADKFGILAEDVLRAYSVFSRVDVDASGKVSTAELHNLLEEVSGQSMNEEEVSTVLKKFDKDSDGELDFEEFLLCFCYTPQQRKKHLKAALYTKSDALDERFRTRMVGVNADSLKRYLRKELDEEQAFLQIPLIFFLFVIFFAAASFHRTTAVMNSIESAVRFDIVENANFAFVGAAPFENGRMGHKGIDDVNSFADFWSWLDLGLGPLFFPSGWSTSEARANVAGRCTSPFDAMSAYAMTNGQTQANTPYGPYANASYAAVTGDLGPNLCNMDGGTAFPAPLEHMKAFGDSSKAPYLGFNEIVAGVRLRQEQLPEVECPQTKYFKHAYDTPCVEINVDAWLHPDLDMVLPMNEDLLDKPGGESVYFRSGMDLTDVHREIRGLEDKRWVNQRTGKIEVTFATYNNHVDMLVGVFINFFVTRAGHIHKIIKPVSFNMQPYGDPWSYVLDSVFVLLVLQLFVVEARQICISLRDQGFKTGLREYFSDFKNIVDWITLAFSTVVFVMWLKWNLLISEMGELLLAANTSVKGSWESGGKNDIYTPSNAAFWQALDDTAQYDEALHVALAFYPIFLGLRFFSAFSAQPRLAIVTKTLMCASSDLMNFGVVMGVVILTFSASAVLLFGREVPEFENFGRAFITVIQGTLGDLDYDELTESGRFSANVWWLVFIVLANCIMLNIVLAIIMDAYSEVKSRMSANIDDFPTIWGQAYEIYRRGSAKRKGLRMGLDYLIVCLEKDDSEESVAREKKHFDSKLVTVSKFMQIAPGLKYTQAERLVTGARNFFERKEALEVETKDVLVALRAVDVKVQQCWGKIESMGESNPDRTDAASPTRPKASGLRNSPNKPADKPSQVGI